MDANESERPAVEDNPGKYDAMTEKHQSLLKADGVLIIVIGGPAGDGFSVVGTKDIIAAVPEILKSVAVDIENNPLAVDDGELAVDDGGKG